jgi:hypothetical protein
LSNVTSRQAPEQDQRTARVVELNDFNQGKRQARECHGCLLIDLELDNQEVASRVQLAMSSLLPVNLTG